MGMAASQARFLGLTARKTNVEYEGQQVNQQRTVLSNESAGLFNQMLTLQVPTPPSATDFYNTRYTFEGLGGDYQITNFAAAAGNSAGLYNITLQYEQTMHQGYSNSPIAKNIPVFFQDDPNNAGSKIPSSIVVEGQQIPITKADPSGIDKGNIDAINQMIKKQEPLRQPENDTYYKYTVNSGSAGERTYYISSYDLDKIKDQIPTDPNVSYTNGLTQYYAADAMVKSTTTGTASFTATADGRFESVLINHVNNEAIDSALAGKSFDLNLEQIQDDQGYAEAMKDYEYQKMQYERAIQDINARTEVLQQQDRTLELRLKQLDTEQKALQTEMEAVQKVIEKNVETTFKTFA